MIYVFLDSKNTNNHNDYCIQFVRDVLKANNFRYKLYFINNFIYDYKIEIKSPNDIILWNPLIAANNQEYVSNISRNSFVLLEHQTDLSQKKSIKNPFNENDAVNLNVKVIYIIDKIIESEFRIPLDKTIYTKTIDEFICLVKSDSTNIISSNKKQLRTFQDLNEIIDLTANIFI